MDNQTNKFLYESQSSDFATSAELEEFKEDINEVIKGKWDLEFSQSGYIADCIIKGKKFFDVHIDVNSFTVIEEGQSVTYKVNVLKVGKEGETSKFFIPDGKLLGGDKFLEKTINTELTYNTLAQDISNGKVTTGAHAIMIDFTDANNPKIILAPYRKTDGTEYWQYLFARNTEPGLVEAEPIWWDTTNNVVKQYNEHGGWVRKNYSIPVGVVILENNAISKISQDFNITGYADQTIWVNPDIEYGLPEGRNENLMIKVVSGITGNNGMPEFVSTATEDNELVETFNVALSDTISYVKLVNQCRDKRVLTITTNTTDSADDEREVEYDNYSLSADQLTIVFDPAITNVKTITAKYYEEPNNIQLFMDASGQLLNPIETIGYEFDTFRGCYVNADNEPQTCVRVGAFSLGYVAAKNKFPNEKLSITEYDSRDCSQLVNATEVEYMLKHHNAGLNESIELAVRTASSAATEVDNLRTDVENGLDKCKNDIDRSASGYEPYIPGGGGDDEGGTGTIKKQYDEMEVIPVGVKVTSGSGVISDETAIGPSVTTYSSDDGSGPVYDNTKGLYDNTTVRIGKTYVKASTFGTSESVYNGKTFGASTSTYNGRTFGDTNSIFNGKSAKVDVSDINTVAGRGTNVRRVNEIFVAQDGSLVTDDSFYLQDSTAYISRIQTNAIGTSSISATSGTFNSLKIGKYTVNPSSTVTYFITGQVDLFKCSTSDVGKLVDFSTGNTVEFETAINNFHGVVGDPDDYADIPAGKVPILFSGRQKVLTMGPANVGNRLYHLSQDMRDELSTSQVNLALIRIINQDKLDQIISSNDYAGIAISEAFITKLLESAQTTGNAEIIAATNTWLDMLGKVVGRVLVKEESTENNTIVYWKLNQVDAAISMTFND